MAKKISPLPIKPMCNVLITVANQGKKPVNKMTSNSPWSNNLAPMPNLVESAV
jgi:hypothetical protein